MDAILVWLKENMLLAASTGVVGLAVTLFRKHLIAAGSKALGKFLGKELAAAEDLNLGDEFIAGRKNIILLAAMEIANRKMPGAPGLDKKAYVMKLFASFSPAIRAAMSEAIDAWWAQLKASIDAGVTPEQEKIIAEAAAKLAGIKK